MRELGVVCRACFCTSEINTHSYMPFLFSINLCHLYYHGITVYMQSQNIYNTCTSDSISSVSSNTGTHETTNSVSTSSKTVITVVSHVSTFINIYRIISWKNSITSQQFDYLHK